jgi:hypothetical protein
MVDVRSVSSQIMCRGNVSRSERLLGYHYCEVDYINA